MTLTPSELAICEATSCRCYETPWKNLCVFWQNETGLFFQNNRDADKASVEENLFREDKCVAFWGDKPITPADALSRVTRPEGREAMLELFKRNVKPTPTQAGPAVSSLPDTRAGLPGASLGAGPAVSELDAIREKLKLTEQRCAELSRKIADAVKAARERREKFAEWLSYERLAAVANQNYERAAALRDVADKGEVAVANHSREQPPTHERHDMTGIELISAERQRQIEVEGWTPEHDDGYTAGDLAEAAACYLHAGMHGFCKTVPPARWPWDFQWWKPKSQITALVKAGALIAAEIDRLNRSTNAKGEP